MTEKTFALPDLGEGLADAELLRWLVAVGDPVALNQVIAEVETAKAAVELPSPYAGRVTALLATEGSTVDVGSPLIRFETSAEVEEAAEPAVEERVPVLVGYGATSGTTSRRTGRFRTTVPGSSRPPDRPLPDLPPDLPPARPGPVARPLARPLAKPLVRKLARDRHVDLTTVTGTGPDGVITRQDVLDHCAPPAPTTPAGPGATSPSGPASPASITPYGPSSRAAREERIPIRGVRRATAAAMVRSAFTAPHVTEFVTVDVTATRDLLNRLRESAFVDDRLTMTAFVAVAMLRALREHPELNSSWDDAAQEIVLRRYVNLGIATAGPRGLLVPNLKDADQLTLIELARALERLTSTARDGHATTADLTGGTITLTNVGMFGVDSGTPIINPGEAAIVCLGAVRQQPWVHEGELAVRWVTTLSLSFDHRLVDGEQGSRYLAAVAETLRRG